jgi:hypothetical protein
VPGSKGTAHFVWRCGMCKRESSAKFDPVAPKPYYNAENEQFGPLLIIECRGLEFVGFDPKVNISSTRIHVDELFAGVLEMRGFQWYKI